MQTLPMLQWKISETKKRLSDSVMTDATLWCLALSALLVITAYASRAITLGGSFGMVTLDIPIVSQPFPDKGSHNFAEQTAASIGSATMIIAVTPGEMIFGDLSAFTTTRDDVRNKFIVPHKEGSPQVTILLKQAEEWKVDRRQRLGLRSDGLVVVLPDTGVPVAVIGGIVEKLKDSRLFSHVMLAGGVL